MIEYKVGDMFAEDVEDPGRTSVNCVGVMGRGNMRLQSQERLSQELQGVRGGLAMEDEVQPGRMLVFETGADDRCTSIHHQLPYQAPLAREESHGGH